MTETLSDYGRILRFAESLRICVQLLHQRGCSREHSAKFLKIAALEALEDSGLDQIREETVFAMACKMHHEALDEFYGPATASNI